MPILHTPFARRRTDQEMVSPEEVPRGRECGCDCAECGGPVMAIQGTEKIWHFRHEKGSDCAGGYVKSVHERAKQLIRQRRELILPPLEAVVQGFDAFGICHEEREPVLKAGRVVLDAARTSALVEDVTVDVLGVVREREILIEVTVHHQLMPEKQRRLIGTGRAVLEIDLSRFKALQATAELLEAALFETASNRRWIHHQKLAEAQLRARKRLDERLAQRKARYDAEAEKRQAQEQHRLAARLAQRRVQSAEPAQTLRAPQRPLPKLPPLPLTTGSIPFFGVPCPSSGAESVWRAGLPEEQYVRAAQTALAKRTGKSLIAVIRVTGQVTRRGELQGVRPDVLAERWGAELGVAPDEIMQFFRDGWFLL